MSNSKSWCWGATYHKDCDGDALRQARAKLLELSAQQAGHNDLRHKHVDTGNEQQVSAAEPVHKRNGTKGGKHIHCAQAHHAQESCTLCSHLLILKLQM
jgi:hypothetical protein